jgi:hypothetical protein
MKTICTNALENQAQQAQSSANIDHDHGAIRSSESGADRGELYAHQAERRKACQWPALPRVAVL